MPTAPLALALLCAGPVLEVDLLHELREAELAYGAFEVERFRQAESRVQREIPCLAEEVQPQTAAAIHRIAGLRAWLDQDADGAARAFAAARATSPETAPFPAEVVPRDDNQPEWVVFRQIDVSSPTHGPAVPVAGTLRYDGGASAGRPAGWPTLVQLEQNGAITASAWLDTADLDPAWPAPHRRPTAAWISGAASVGVLGAGVAVYGAFRRQYTDFCGEPAPLLAASCPDADRVEPGWFGRELGWRQTPAWLLMGAGAAGLVVTGTLTWGGGR